MNCINCEKEISPNHKFCSNSCSTTWYHKNKPEVHKGWISSPERNEKISIAQKGVKETEETRQQTSEVMRQYYKNHPEKNSWRRKSLDGFNPIYGEDFTDILKKVIKERDGVMCQHCKSEHLLVVHHKDFNKFNNSYDNLITVCRSCHGVIHSSKSLVEV
jgi:hypothetical protein